MDIDQFDSQVAPQVVDEIKSETVTTKRELLNDSNLKPVEIKKVWKYLFTVIIVDSSSIFSV